MTRTGTCAPMTTQASGATSAQRHKLSRLHRQEMRIDAKKKEPVVTDHLLETFDNGIATLTMNRPEARNAMSADMTDKLHEALPRLASDRKVRCVVLTGTGGA